MKRLFQGINPGHAWVNAVTQRLRVGTCDGRRTLDKDLLLTALATRLPIAEAEGVSKPGTRPENLESALCKPDQSALIVNILAQCGVYGGLAI